MAKGDSPTKEARVISASKLKSLLNSGAKMKEDVNTLTADHAAEVREAVEKFNLKKSPFGVVKKLWRMEAENLRDWLDSFNHMLDVSGLSEKAASAPPLPIGETDAEEEEQPDGSPEQETRRGRNVKPFPKPTAVSTE